MTDFSTPLNYDIKSLLKEGRARMGLEEKPPKQIAWIDERIQGLLSQPKMWGTKNTVEVCVLLLLEMRLMLLNPEADLENLGRGLDDRYRAFLKERLPSKPGSIALFAHAPLNDDRFLALLRDFVVLSSQR